MRRLLLSTILLFVLSSLLFAGRYYDAATGRFLQIDPHASKYPSLSPYSYVANNPLNSVDPDGKDVVVLNDSDGAYGFGHNAVVVGNDDDGWTYYSYDGDGAYTTQSFDSYSDFGKSDVAKRYNRSVRFTTTKKQDNNAKKQGTAETKKKRDGSVDQILNDNCAHVVKNVAEKANIILPDRTIPNKQLDDAKKEKQKREEARKKEEERKKQEEQKKKNENQTN
jgi:uncharacterized protein RhaS with RHS repeats